MHTLTRKRPEEPARVLETLQDRINHLFDLSHGRAGASKETMFPSVDVSEDTGNVYVEADIPGLEQKDIAVSINDDYLVLSSDKEENGEETERDYYRVERFQGGFCRAICLPSPIDVSRATARYRNGVLNVTLPKKEESRGTEITISAE